MFRIIVCKVMLAICLCYHAYLLYYEPKVRTPFQEKVQMHFQKMGISQTFIGTTLKLYFIHIILFCLFSSLITIFTKSAIPKVLNIIGILMWFYFSYHPKVTMMAIDREMLKQIICIIGGILYLIGVDYQRKKNKILIKEYQKNNEASKKTSKIQ